MNGAARGPSGREATAYTISPPIGRPRAPRAAAADQGKAVSTRGREEVTRAGAEQVRGQCASGADFGRIGLADQMAQRPPRGA